MNIYETVLTVNCAVVNIHTPRLWESTYHSYNPASEQAPPAANSTSKIPIDSRPGSHRIFYIDCTVSFSLNQGFPELSWASEVQRLRQQALNYANSGWLYKRRSWVRPIPCIASGICLGENAASIAEQRSHWGFHITYGYNTASFASRSTILVDVKELNETLLFR